MPVPSEGAGTKAPAPAKPPGAPQSAQPAQPTDSRSRWSRDLLVKMGLPVTPENIRFLNAWQEAEGTRAKFNPLATTQPMAGAGQFNSVGVRNYTTYEQGLDATVRTLRNGRYGPILAALKTGTDATAGARAVAGSPWGTGEGVLRVLKAGGGGAGSGQAFAEAQAAEDAAFTAGKAKQDPSKMTDAQIVASIASARSRYGYLGFLLDNPEVRRVLIIAVRNGWGDDEIQGELVKTPWWKTTTEAQRNWDAKKGQKDSTAAAEINQRHGELRQLAARLGVKVDDRELRTLAEQSLRNDWTSQQVQGAIAARFSLGANEELKASGQAAVSIADMRALAAQYAITLSDAELARRTRDMLAGTSTIDDFRADLIEMAKGMYAGNEAMAKALDGGRTVRQTMDAYGQDISRLLGVDPTMIDWTDTKWMRFAHTYDATAKEFRPMTLDEARKAIKTDPTYGYLTTTAGRQEQAQFFSGLARQFGAA